MAAPSLSSCRRRLSELLKEEQEPFLLHRRPCNGAARGARARASSASACCPWRLLRIPNARIKKKRSASGNADARNLAKRLKSCAGFFGCRLADVGNGGGAADGEGRHWAAKPLEEEAGQRSPMSVLDELVSDESCTLTQSHSMEDDKTSTSGSSPPTSEELSTLSDGGGGGGGGGEATKKWPRAADSAMQVQINALERMVRDMAMIPDLIRSDARSSDQHCNQQLNLEVKEIGNRIETLIFDDIRSETVRNMLISCCTLKTS